MKLQMRKQRSLVIFLGCPASKWQCQTEIRAVWLQSLQLLCYNHELFLFYKNRVILNAMLCNFPFFTQQYLVSTHTDDLIHLCIYAALHWEHQDLVWPHSQLATKQPPLHFQLLHFTPTKFYLNWISHWSVTCPLFSSLYFSPKCP